MAQDTFDRSLWSALTPPAEAAVPLDGDLQADVVVVGAGFLGLSLSLHLAERGVRVALLEAAEPGFGASGRNTGFVVPSLKTALGPADVVRHLGPAGDRLTDLVGRSGTLVFDLVRRLGIDCSAEQTGWMQPAHTAAMFETLEQRQRDWAARGRHVEIVDAAETQRRLGAPGYPGALVDPTGGQINPLAYARGLARAARRAGVMLHDRTPVTRVARTDARWAVETGRGRVRADRVVLATNAFVGRLAPAVASSIIPVRVHQIATEPLGDELRRTILPGRSPAADTRRHTFAVRWSPDNRLVTGGLVLPGPSRPRRATRYFTRRLEAVFPMAGPLSAAFVWNGVVATTLDSLPRFMTLEPGLDAVIGCNGRGIALTTALGQSLAAHLGGAADAQALPLPHATPRRVPAHRLARLGPAVWLPWSDWQDHRDIARL